MVGVARGLRVVRAERARGQADRDSGKRGDDRRWGQASHLDQHQRAKPRVVSAQVAMPAAELYSAALELSSAATAPHLKVGFAAHLFYAPNREVMSVTQEQIEKRLADVEPDVEVLLLEPANASTMRLFIDRPGGVDLELCERVTNHLRDILLETGLEVSSPGPERPLTKPDHFRRYIGRRARVRTREDHGGRKSFTGELVGASDDEVTVAADTGVVSIPYTEINRSNLLEG